MTPSDDPANATVKDLLQRIADTRAVLDGVVVPLSPAQREAPLGGKWSVKLHLAHVADWEVGILALLQGEGRVQAMGLTQALWDAGDTDAMNATMADRAERQPLEDVMIRYREIHRNLVRHIGGMADADLQLPYEHFQPGAHPSNPAPILNWIAGNTVDHYPEHAQWITEDLATR